MIEIVCATRLDPGDFHARSLLGRSLERLRFDLRLVPRIEYSNTRGLPEVYNGRIDDVAAPEGNLLVFVHDDVWIDDFLFGDRLLSAVASYDLIGVAGNRRRLPGRPAGYSRTIAGRSTASIFPARSRTASPAPDRFPTTARRPLPASCWTGSCWRRDARRRRPVRPPVRLSFLRFRSLPCRPRPGTDRRHLADLHHPREPQRLRLASVARSAASLSGEMG